VPAFATEFQGLPFLFAVLTAVFPVSTAFLNLAFAGGVGALGSFGHRHPPGGHLTPVSRTGSLFQQSGGDSWTSGASTDACPLPPKNSASWPLPGGYPRQLSADDLPLLGLPGIVTGRDDPGGDRADAAIRRRPPR
jgi:hypothetical protein